MEVTPNLVGTCAAEAWAAVHDGSNLPILQKLKLSTWIANVGEPVEDGSAPPKGFVSELVAPGPSSVTRCGVLAPDVRARCGSPPMLYTYLTTLSPDRDAGTEETTDNRRRPKRGHERRSPTGCLAPLM